jgi:hypothetical protein
LAPKSVAVADDSLKLLLNNSPAQNTGLKTRRP